MTNVWPRNIGLITEPYRKSVDGFDIYWIVWVKFYFIGLPDSWDSAEDKNKNLAQAIQSIAEVKTVSERPDAKVECSGREIKIA